MVTRDQKIKATIEAVERLGYKASIDFDGKHTDIKVWGEASGYRWALFEAGAYAIVTDSTIDDGYFNITATIYEEDLTAAEQHEELMKEVRKQTDNETVIALYDEYYMTFLETESFYDWCNNWRFDPDAIVKADFEANLIGTKEEIEEHFGTFDEGLVFAEHNGYYLYFKG